MKKPARSEYFFGCVLLIIGVMVGHLSMCNFHPVIHGADGNSLRSVAAKEEAGRRSPGYSGHDDYSPAGHRFSGVHLHAPD